MAVDCPAGRPGSHFESASFDFSLLLDFFLYAHGHVSAARRVQQSFAVITTKRVEMKIIAASAAVYTLRSQIIKFLWRQEKKPRTVPIHLLYPQHILVSKLVSFNIKELPASDQARLPA
jgi:hypothetical protein